MRESPPRLKAQTVAGNGASRSAEAIKALGAFYTPASLADLLAEWAIRGGKQRVLEPSAGGGALVGAALQFAKQHQASIELLACDVDPTAINTLKSRFGSSVETRKIDFLDLSPKTTKGFDVVLANPPFTRNHAIESGYRRDIRKRFGIEGAAGIWVPFLLHATSFLVTGGRLAAIAPAAALFTRYGEAFLKRLCEMFPLVVVCRLLERQTWEGGAEERGCLIFADGRGLGTASACETISWPSTQDSGAAPAGEAVQLKHHTQTLGDIAHLSIGAVTGRNDVFLLNEDERKRYAISKRDVRPIVARGRHLKGITISADELAKLAEDGQKTWLLQPRALGKGVESRLSLITRKERESVVWFNKREPWWKVDPGPNCDAIFTYMNHAGPRLALAQSPVVCTNTLHRVVFHPTTPTGARHAAVLTLISTYGQLAAELLGRSYGGGVLKFELANARMLPVLPTPGDLSKHVIEVDCAVRNGDSLLASELADNALLSPLLGRTWKAQVDLMRKQVVHLRRVRGFFAEGSAQ